MIAMEVQRFYRSAKSVYPFQAMKASKMSLYPFSKAIVFQQQHTSHKCWSGLVWGCCFFRTKRQNETHDERCKLERSPISDFVYHGKRWNSPATEKNIRICVESQKQSDKIAVGSLVRECCPSDKPTCQRWNYTVKCTIWGGYLGGAIDEILMNFFCRNCLWLMWICLHWFVNNNNTFDHHTQTTATILAT